MPDRRDAFLARNIEQAVHRISALGERSIGLSADARPLLQEALLELTALVEELEATSEELRQQNEHYMLTRTPVEDELDWYRTLFLAAPLPNLITTAEGVIREANTAAAAFLGVEADELNGKPLSTFVPLASRSEFRRHMHEASNGSGAASWTMQIFPRHAGPRTVEVRCVRMHRNDVVKLRWIIAADTDSSAGVSHATCCSASAAHLSGAALADEIVVALHDAETLDTMLARLLRRLVPDVADFCVIDIAGVGGRRERCGVMHADAEKLPLVKALLEQGDDPSSRFKPLPDCTPEVKPFDDDVIESLGATPGERDALRGLQLDVCLCVPLSVRVVPIGTLTLAWHGAGPLSEEVPAILHACERVALLLSAMIDSEARKQATESATDSLLGLGHDLRAPLRAIAAHAAVLEARGNIAAARGGLEPLATIRSAAQHLGEMVDEVIASAGTRTESPLLRVRDVNVNVLVRDVVLLFSPAAAQQGISIGLAAPEHPVIIVSEPSSLRRVVITLLDRAIEQAAGSELRISVGSERDGASIDISIANGARSDRDSEVDPSALYDGDPDEDELGIGVARRLVGMLHGDLRLASAATGCPGCAHLWLPGQLDAE